MTTEAEWRAKAQKLIAEKIVEWLTANTENVVGAQIILDALIAAGWQAPASDDVVPERHVRWRIPIQRGEDGSLFIDGEQHKLGWFTRYPDLPVVGTIIADIPLPSEPPVARGRVEKP